MIRWR